MKTAELQGYMNSRRIDFALFFNFNHFNPNMFYFSGCKNLGCLVIPKKGRKLLIVPEMDAEVARKTGNKVIVYRKEFYETLLKCIKGSKKVGVEKQNISVRQYAILKSKIKHKNYVGIDKVCHKLRETKTKHELLKIWKSCKLAEQIIEKCIAHFNFRTESDVAAFLEYEAIKQGAEVAFPVIVASGKNTSMPHHHASRQKLARGFLMIDFGVRLDGYCSDITRTFYIGKPGRREIELYNKIIECKIAIIKKVRPGIRCKEVANTGGKILGIYKKNMIHSYGHGLGVEVHESPNLSPRSKDAFSENNVFTVEPGIYIKNRHGIRVESVAAVTGNGCRFLTSLPKQLKPIKQKVY